jgi:hypothetical protein
MSRLKWVVLALIVVVIGGAVALVLVERPKLADARTTVDEAWKPLTAPDQLVTRYQKLEGALSAFDAAGGKGRSVSRDLHGALQQWKTALKDGDAGAQVDAGNTVEAQGARLYANVVRSERFSGDAAAKDALAAWAGTIPKRALVTAYNRATRSFEDTRTGWLARPVALALGYSERPQFRLANLEI